MHAHAAPLARSPSGAAAPSDRKKDLLPPRCVAAMAPRARACGVTREKLSHAEPARPEIRQHLAQLAVSRMVANHSSDLSLPQKQLALLVVLEELMKGLPADYQPANTLAM